MILYLEATINYINTSFPNLIPEMQGLINEGEVKQTNDINYLKLKEE